MDATTFLQVDHDTLKTALRALTDASADSALRRMTFRSLRDRLEMHARIEEDVFYPAVMKVRSHAARENVNRQLVSVRIIDRGKLNARVHERCDKSEVARQPI